MVINDVYGFDQFCASLVDQWPEVSLSFRRTDSRLFVGASSLGLTSAVVSKDEELPGTTVRRALTDLHARLVVRGNGVGAAVQGLRGGGTRERVLALATRLADICRMSTELEEAEMELSDFLAGEEIERGVGEVGEDIKRLRKALEESDEDSLRKELEDLDPDGDIEQGLLDEGLLEEI